LDIQLVHDPSGEICDFRLVKVASSPWPVEFVVDQSPHPELRQIFGKDDPQEVAVGRI
jgi:hypothetical protein